MKLISFLICNEIIRNNDKAQSLNGLFDTVTVSAVPCTGPFNIYIKFLCPNGEHKIKLEFYGPKGPGHILRDNNMEIANPYEIPFKHEGGNFHEINALLNNQLVFTEYGDYKIVLSYGENYQTKIEYPISVVKNA